MLCALQAFALHAAYGAVAPVEILDTVSPWVDAAAPTPGLRAVAYDTEAYTFQGNPVLRNGRISIALLDTGIHVFSVHDGAETLRTRIQLLGPDEVPAQRLTAVEITPDAHGELINRRDRASVTVTYTADGITLEARIELARDAVLCRLTPLTNVESARLYSNPEFLLMPAFVGDDLLVAAADHRPGRAFLPSDNILMEFVDDGNAIVQIVWPIDGEQIVEAEIAETAGGRRVEFVRVGLDGQPLFVACWEHDKLWRVEPVDERFTDADGRTVDVPIAWRPPFEAEWRAVYHGDRSTSWELRAANAVGQLGPHGMQTAYAWPLRRHEAGVGLHHPPRKIHEGAASMVLLYPLQRARNTPRHIRTPADVLRLALGDGPCDYLLAREQRPQGSDGGPLCVIAGRFGVLTPIYARDARASEFMAQLARWHLAEGVFQYRRARDYLDFANDVQDRIDTLLQANPALADPFEELRGWNAELVERAVSIIDVLPGAKAGWTDFVPASDDAIEAMTEILEHLLERLQAPRSPETLAEWRDVIGKLHHLSVNPQTRLPRARRLTRMIQNEATRLAPMSPHAADFAARVRFEARRTLQGAHWAEEER